MAVRLWCCGSFEAQTKRSLGTLHSHKSIQMIVPWPFVERMSKCVCVWVACMCHWCQPPPLYLLLMPLLPPHFLQTIQTLSITAMNSIKPKELIAFTKQKRKRKNIFLISEGFSYYFIFPVLTRLYKNCVWYMFTDITRCSFLSFVRLGDLHSHSQRFA